MKNNIFNAKRFGSYFATDIKTGFVSNATTLAVVACIPLILYILYGVLGLIFLRGWHSIGIEARITAMLFTGIVVLIAAPVKGYGGLTEKKSGSFWLMVPASPLEKTVSMIVICSIIAPLAIFVSYGCIDALICLIDSGCGRPILDFNPISMLIGEINDDLAAEGVANYLSVMFNPLLYIDDIIQIPLCFLLGALIFKKNKISKTILSLIALGTIFGAITAPFFINRSIETVSENDVYALFDRYKWLFEHLALVDTISDTVTNLAICTGIYFRVKTIKH